MSKLVLIDGNAILHRAYHALPPLTSKTGEPINAVYGLTSMLLRIVHDLSPTHIAVCFDRKEPTFRHVEFKAYQAHRPKMEDDLSSQFTKAKDVLAAMNIPIYEMAGYEADDIIGTLAKQAVCRKIDEGGPRVDSEVRSKKSEVESPTSNLKLQDQTSNFNLQSSSIDEVVIVTGDRDILQLVDDKKNIKVYLPKKGLSDAQLMGEAGVIEKLGVTPKQIVDYKALVGDPSDNYKGVTGIGPKTAERLIHEHGSYQGIYNNINKIDENTQKKLKDGKDSAKQSYWLAKIITDVKIKPDFDDMGNWQINSRELLALFEEFGFQTLRKRVDEVGKRIVSKDQMKML